MSPLFLSPFFQGLWSVYNWIGIVAVILLLLVVGIYLIRKHRRKPGSRPLKKVRARKP